MHVVSRVGAVRKGGMPVPLAQQGQFTYDVTGIE